jgi:hypothetical protein
MMPLASMNVFMAAASENVARLRSAPPLLPPFVPMASDLF